MLFIIYLLISNYYIIHYNTYFEYDELIDFNKKIDLIYLHIYLFIYLFLNKYGIMHRYLSNKPIPLIINGR